MQFSVASYTHLMAILIEISVHLLIQEITQADSGFLPVSQEQESEATLGTGSSLTEALPGLL